MINIIKCEFFRLYKSRFFKFLIFSSIVVLLFGLIFRYLLNFNINLFKIEDRIFKSSLFFIMDKFYLLLSILLFFELFFKLLRGNKLRVFFPIYADRRYLILASYKSFIIIFSILILSIYLFCESFLFIYNCNIFAVDFIQIASAILNNLLLVLIIFDFVFLCFLILNDYIYSLIVLALCFLFYILVKFIFVVEAVAYAFPFELVINYQVNSYMYAYYLFILLILNLSGLFLFNYRNIK